jgi:hypothetical protein
MIIRQESFNDLKICVRDVSAEVARTNGYSSGVWQHGGKINWNKDIVIGFSPTNYHAFLMVGETEFHPRFSFNKIKVRKMNRDSIRAAFFIVIKNLTYDQIERVERLIIGVSGKRTLSCIEGVKQALFFGAGLKIPKMSDCDLYISQILYMIMLAGITDRFNKPTELEFYTTKHITIKKMFEEITFAEKTFNPFGILSYYLFNFLSLFSKNVIRSEENYRPLFFNNSLSDLKKE